MFAEGTYRMTIALYQGDPVNGRQHHFDFVNGACSFQIIPDTEDEQYISWYHPGWGSVRMPDIVAFAKEDEG